MPWSMRSRPGWKPRWPLTWANRWKIRMATPFRPRGGDLTKRNLKSLDQFRAGDQVLIREAQDDNPGTAHTLADTWT